MRQRRNFLWRQGTVPVPCRQIPARLVDAQLPEFGGERWRGLDVFSCFLRLFLRARLRVCSWFGRIGRCVGRRSPACQRGSAGFVRRRVGASQSSLDGLAHGRCDLVCLQTQLDGFRCRVCVSNVCACDVAKQVESRRCDSRYG